QARAAYLNGRRSDLYDLGLYLVLMYEGGDTGRTSTRLRNLLRSPKKAFHDWLSSSHTCAVLESELNRSIATLHHKAQGFEVQLSDLGVERLKKADAFGFFRQLVNYNPAVASASRLKYDTHLD